MRKETTEKLNRLADFLAEQAEFIVRAMHEGEDDIGALPDDEEDVSDERYYLELVLDSLNDAYYSMTNAADSIRNALDESKKGGCGL